MVLLHLLSQSFPWLQKYIVNMSTSNSSVKKLKKKLFLASLHIGPFEYNLFLLKLKIENIIAK